MCIRDRCGTLTHFAAHPDLSAVQFDELATERQAQTGALLLRRARSDLTELLEDDPLIFRGDANPGVPDRYLDTSVSLCRLNSDPAAFRRKLNRIRQEVQQDLLDLPLIRPDCGHSGVNRDVQYQRAMRGALADEGQRVRKRLREVEVRHLQLHSSCFNLREIEDVVD